ncbi:low temperature requirement protein A [Micromonospora sp. NPDC000089]|uniref:low temperature requirement protein A n=1 Tax=unclassified Micromonospora TaxID=2617518 RepID=UPI0036BB15AB
MSRAGRRRATLTPEDHGATTFEIFFDIVFIFALTRITALMGSPPRLSSMGQGLLLLVLLWFSWSAYTWLGNLTPADVGLARAGVLVSMAGLFVVALVIPDAWRSAPGVDGAMILAVSYVLLRAVHLLVALWAAGPDAARRRRVAMFALPITVGWVPFLVGALLGGTAQTALWVTALVLDIGGQRLFQYRRWGEWPLRSPSHFTERHRLVLIIALGESLISAGVGVGSHLTRLSVLGAALVAFTVTVCLWWLYFGGVADVAARALTLASPARRNQLGSDAFSLAHLPMVAGVIYLALGGEQAIAHVAEAEPAAPAGAPLGWPAALALFGGAALYLVGRLLVLRLSEHSPSPGQWLVAGLPLLLLPIGHAVPALAALGLLAALLTAICVVLRLRPARSPV